MIARRRFPPVLAVIQLAACAIALAACHGPTPEPGAAPAAAIDREALVTRHDPQLHTVDPESPFTLGNGRFAFTADVTGLQSLPDFYFKNGIPLETKARWAWHSRRAAKHYRLRDVAERYAAYGREVDFPTRTGTAAADWLRQNPHDLPLARIGFVLDGKPLAASEISEVYQHLDLWHGVLDSRYSLAGRPVHVTTAVHSDRDLVAARIDSPLLAEGRLAVTMRFPRGYDPKVKNTPGVVFGSDGGHFNKVAIRTPDGVVIERRVDDDRHFVRVSWAGPASLQQTAPHVFVLAPAKGAARIDASFEFSGSPPSGATVSDFDAVVASSATAFERFWRYGAAVDFSGSTDPRAAELERRIVLSRYLMAVQSRADIPPQETGLTSSSWYGKLHTETSWWHSAHWALWGQPQYLERVLGWYLRNLAVAENLAAQRGLAGARWAKMVGPDDRESPGGNPLIVWNQPQPIHLAELVYRAEPYPEVLQRYAKLVDETAEAMASMLVRDAERERYSLGPPVWIAQEIYDPRETSNPAFELAYWRYGLTTAQQWRERLGEAPNPDWQAKLDRLAELPEKDGRYVAIESIPDTFDNAESRHDHPTMLAPFGLLDDTTVDRGTMGSTLDAVLANWDFEGKIWGWDYPMIAMTATRLGRPGTALDILLADRPHNRYLPNGHCPQQGAGLPVYLPANGALLAAVAMMAAGWDGAPDRPAPGFPDDGTWTVRAEGLVPLD
jgi:hypothetical protein